MGITADTAAADRITIARNPAVRASRSWRITLKYVPHGRSSTRATTLDLTRDELIALHDHLAGLIEAGHL